MWLLQTTGLVVVEKRREKTSAIAIDDILLYVLLVAWGAAAAAYTETRCVIVPVRWQVLHLGAILLFNIRFNYSIYCALKLCEWLLEDRQAARQRGRELDR